MYFNRCKQSHCCSSLNNNNLNLITSSYLLFSLQHYLLSFNHSLLMTHFTSKCYYTFLLKIWHGSAAYLPVVIYYYTHFLLTIITHVEGSNGVNTGPTKHWLPFLNNTRTPYIENKALDSNLLQPKPPTKRILTTSHPPILESVLKPGLPKAAQFTPVLFPLPSLTFYGPHPPTPRGSRGSAMHVFVKA